MKKSFYSHGKLLLTSEYLVLDGVQALAIPTKKGQWLFIEEKETKIIEWKSFDQEGHCWFETTFVLEEDILKPNQEDQENLITKTLATILNTAKALNPNFLSSAKGYQVESKLEFHRQWGLGSSSTLINNIAQWAKVNAFVLLDKSFGGSGYDIACAQHETPIVYTRTEGKPNVQEVDFDPSFKDELFFVYLISLKNFDKAAKHINEITTEVLNCNSITDFESLIDQHEEIISGIIKTDTVKSRLFPDYHRSIKSLGGWGGDFVLATGTLSEMTYFKEKGYETIISYAEMVL